MNDLFCQHNFFFHFGSDPQNISFHFLIPEGGNDKLPYHKLKVVLPDSNLTVTRWAHKPSFCRSCHCGHSHTCVPCSQRQIKDKLNVATPEGNFLWLFHKELSPLLIAKSQLSKKRYLHISADSIVKVLDILFIHLLRGAKRWPLGAPPTLFSSNFCTTFPK